MTNLIKYNKPDQSPSCSMVPCDDEPVAIDQNRFRLRTLIALFMAESLALALLQLPLTLDFSSFMLMDQGSNLTVQKLLDRGLIPTVDFGYQYGLLALLIGRTWFALLGQTPEAYAAAMLVFDLLIAWGLARCAYALRAGLVGITLLLFTMLATTLGSYINLAHACEATLICHALAEHANGRRPRALALLTACLFAKPVMAYVYGFLIVLLIVRRGGILGLMRSAPPAIAVGALLLTGLAAWFGLGPVVQTLLPLRGAEAYRILNHGFFFGIGRDFWLPPRVTPRHYIFSPAGHYLVGSVVLVAATIASIWRLVRRAAAIDDINAEVIACCGIMHLSFLTSFYGAWASWTYYYHILIIGLVAVAARGRRSAMVIALLAVMALAGFKDTATYIKSEWLHKIRAADTFGLWAHTDFREEWRQIRQITEDKPASFIANNGGCLEMFAPQFASAEDMFLTPGWPIHTELQRKVQQITMAEIVVISKVGCVRPMLDLWPEFREALNGFELVKSTQRFLIYQRSRSSPLHHTELKAKSARIGRQASRILK
jgi:hypothetical protein